MTVASVELELELGGISRSTRDCKQKSKRAEKFAEHSKFNSNISRCENTTPGDRLK